MGFSGVVCVHVKAFGGTQTTAAFSLTAIVGIVGTP